MRVEALSYVRARARTLALGQLRPGLLGLQRVDKSRSTSRPHDDRKQRIIVNADGGEGIDVFGWEVADATALERWRRSSMRECESRRGTRALADERMVKD